jgi:hypothetical protein
VVRLIQQVYPQLEVHGSTQMTVHDESGARVMHALGVERVVLARENTLEDIRAIREAVPDLSLETFVHGALCISYSGQCFMSGMISERSANRGSCAQSCRKDYTLTDETTKATLDSGYLISSKDLAAHDHLEEIAKLGVGCLKVEGRKKKPEYVATVTKAYRGWLDGIARGETGRAPTPDEVEPLVQIFSRGNTGGMYGGRQGREYITRTQPDNRGLPIGMVTGADGQSLIIEVSRAVAVGDGLGFEAPAADAGATVGGTVTEVKTLTVRAGVYRQVVLVKSGPRTTHVPEGWHVVRTSDATLLAGARESFAGVPMFDRVGLQRVDVRSAAQMRSAVLDALPADIYIGAAAVSDYTPRQVAPQKLKKTAGTQTLTLELVRTQDILAEVAQQTNALKLVVGFAAETHDVEKYARGKLVDKRLDLVIANQVGISTGGFESDENAATAYWQGGEQVFPGTSKAVLAEQLLSLIAQRLHA